MEQVATATCALSTVFLKYFTSVVLSPDCSYTWDDTLGMMSLQVYSYIRAAKGGSSLLTMLTGSHPLSSAIFS